MLNEVEKLLAGLCVMNDGTDGDVQNEIRSVASAFVAALSLVPALGFLDRFEPKLQKRIVLFVGAQNHMAAASAVSAGRAASWNVLLPPKRDATAPAVPRQD